MGQFARRGFALTVALVLSFSAVGVGTVLAVAVAGPDAYPVLEDQVLTVPAPGVFENDVPASGEVICLVNEAIASSQGGEVVQSANGSFTYTPPPNFAGTDTFTYGVADRTPAGICPDVQDSSATVTLTVTQVNDPPTVVLASQCDDGITVAEDSGAFSRSDCVNILDFGPGDPGQTLVGWVVTPENPALFSVQPFVTLDDPWLLRFTLASNAHGVTKLTVQARDGGGTANGGVDLSAGTDVDLQINPTNDPPSATNDTYSALRDTTLNIAAPGVLGNDGDIDGDSITAVLVTPPIHGQLTLAANGSFRYTPQAGYTGLDAFSYRASDGVVTSAIRVVTLNVTAVPSPTPTPVVSVAPTASPSTAPSLEIGPSPSAEATASIDPAATASAAPVSTAAPSPAPGSTAAPSPVDEEGGLSLPVLLVLVLLAVLLAFGAAFYVPRWIQSRRTAGEIDDSY